MDGEWQTWIVLGIVALAAVWMVRRFLGKSGGSCGGGCDCPGKTITPKRGGVMRALLGLLSCLAQFPSEPFPNSLSAAERMRG